MRLRNSFDKLGKVVLQGAALGVIYQAAWAQGVDRPSAPVDLPKGPAKPGFDIARFSSAGNGWFKTFYVTETNPLQKVLEQGKVAADTKVLVTTTAAGRLALLTDQMAYHHIAAGQAHNKDWMATF